MYEEFTQGQIGKEYFKNYPRTGLPAWAYTSEKYFKYETEKLFLTNWQIVGHETSIAKNGDYFTFDLLSERALVIRGNDGIVRAFSNICRHRSSRLVAAPQGNCGKLLQCPFHGWTYNLDGTLRGTSEVGSYGDDIDKKLLGLTPLEMEIWQGFVFVRFKKSNQPSVREIFANLINDFNDYPLHLVNGQNQINASESPILGNWKCAVDVDNEGYHVPRLHTYLQDLYGGQYYDVPLNMTNSGNWSGVSRGIFNERPKKYWTTRLYKELTEKYCNFTKPRARNQVLYISLFPNNVFQLYPESISFYQFLPVDVGFSKIRYANYAFSQESRELRMINKLSLRIDNVTTKEDGDATDWTYQAAKSHNYQGVYLSNYEANVHAYHEKMRDLIPQLRFNHEPDSFEN